MPRILKIYDIDPKTLVGVPGLRVVEAYPAFVIAEVDAKAASKIAATSALTEDITGQYAIAHEHGGIDTNRPRIDTLGKTQPHRAYRGAPKLPPGPHHYLVQFIGPIKKSWLATVKKAGAEVVAPWGGFAVVARMTAREASELAKERMVRWVGHLPYSARLSLKAKGAKGGESPDPRTPRTRYVPGAYVVQFFQADLAVAARTKIKRLGFDIVDEPPRSDVVIVHAQSSKGSKGARIDTRLKDLSRVHGVRNISPQPIPRTSNDQAAVIMATAKSLGAARGAAAGLGLSGKGEIIGVCDTGLDNGDPATIHPDFKGRVAAITSYPISASFARFVKNPGADDGPADLDSGHGTHTSGSVLGNGSSSAALPGLAGPLRGLAYNAKLVFQAVEQEMKWKDPADSIDQGRFVLAGLPNDLTTLFTWAYSKGARIHSNSWGGGDRGAYDTQCQKLDKFVWSHPDFCILFAAGNDGTDHDRNGIVDDGSVTPPGTAKNCITVGASENYRPSMPVVYGQWKKDYPVPPISTDKLADNANQVAAFSSRGPTRGGRKKPDVVAPGTYILSTRSRLLATNQYGYGRYKTSKLYMFDSGTSMATPLTAGAVGVIREYLRKRVKIANPSAALLKASLIAGAVGIDPSSECPNNNEGFGRVNIDAILAPARPVKAKFIEGAGLATGTFSDMMLKVRKDGSALKVVLAYSDYPGPQLVNNLNLILTGPDGINHTGNATPGSTAFDAHNNVEVITIPSADAGSWRVRIVASNVPNGPQPFALVVLGAVT
jgi:hypothetical protein